MVALILYSIIWPYFFFGANFWDNLIESLSCQNSKHNIASAVVLWFSFSEVNHTCCSNSTCFYGQCYHQTLFDQWYFQVVWICYVWMLYWYHEIGSIDIYMWLLHLVFYFNNIKGIIQDCFLLIQVELWFQTICNVFI